MTEEKDTVALLPRYYLIIYTAYEFRTCMPIILHIVICEHQQFNTCRLTFRNALIECNRQHFFHYSIRCRRIHTLYQVFQAVNIRIARIQHKILCIQIINESYCIYDERDWSCKKCLLLLVIKECLIKLKNKNSFADYKRSRAVEHKISKRPAKYTHRPLLSPTPLKCLKTTKFFSAFW